MNYKPQPNSLKNQWIMRLEKVKTDLSFLSKYYKKKSSFERLQNELEDCKTFILFLHDVIDEKEREIKRYEGYKTKYEHLKDSIRHKGSTYTTAPRDQYGRKMDKKFWFPFK